MQRHFGEYAEDIFQASSILGYLNNKTKAANRGSKARGAFANHYALYVVVEDYIKNGFADGKAAAAKALRFQSLLSQPLQLLHASDTVKPN